MTLQCKPVILTVILDLVARIYTISVESMDVMLLGNFGISFLLSSSVLVAAKYYRKEKGYKKID